MNAKPARTTAIDEFQRETWDDDGGATLEGPRTTSRVPPEPPASPNAGRETLDRTSRRAIPGFPPAVLRT